MLGRLGPASSGDDHIKICRAKLSSEKTRRIKHILCRRGIVFLHRDPHSEYILFLKPSWFSAGKKVPSSSSVLLEELATLHDIGKVTAVG